MSAKESVKPPIQPVGVRFVENCVPLVERDSTDGVNLCCFLYI